MSKIKVWLIWLGFVTLWNFGFPNVHPIEDVLVAVILSLVSMGLQEKND